MDSGGVEPIRPFVVVEGRHGAAGAQVTAAVDRALAAAEADGWRVIHGWAAPIDRLDRIVCTGRVRSSDDTRLALDAAMSGARLAVRISADPGTAQRFLEDLRRLGPVDHVAVLAPEAPRLDAGQRALLGLLGSGRTVREAAAELGVPVRTAEARLAGARQALGGGSTAAALFAGGSDPD